MTNLTIIKKIQLLTLIAIISSVSILVFVDSAFAEHGEKPVGSDPYSGFEEDNHNDIVIKDNIEIKDSVDMKTNHGHDQPQSLKVQINDGLSKDKIQCSNSNQVLVERTNDRLACVYPGTAEKLDWKLIL